jgi:hypothetical protein
MTLVAEIGLIVLAAAAVIVCIALLPGRQSAVRRTAVRPRTSRPRQLTSLELLVSSAATSALHVHAYLRPLLAEIASQRLAVHGRSLKTMPDSAGRSLLGEQLWELVRPERPFPHDRYSPGVSRRELAAMLDALERL